MNKEAITIKTLLRIFANIRRDHTGAFAAQTAFFLIMSFIPMLFLIITVIKFYITGTDNIYNALTANNIFAQLTVPSLGYGQFSGNSFFSVLGSVILSAWSAGKSFKALTDGLHSVLHISDSRNYILSRIRGLICSVVFAIVSGTLFLVGIFGERLCLYLEKNDLFPLRNVSYFFGFDEIFVFCFLLVIFVLIYRFVPDWSEYSKFGRKRIAFKYIFGGALISTAVMCIYTVLFSRYINEYSNFTDVYGNLTTLVSVMLWLYVSMYILILGFRISYYISVRNER